MKHLLSSLILTIALSGCITGGLPSTSGGDTSKNFYRPSGGQWSPADFAIARGNDTKISKAKIGAGIGTVAGVMLTQSSGDPLLMSAAAVAGLIIGYSIGDTFDKVDRIHANMILAQSLDNNQNFQPSNWTHPKKNIAVNVMPLTSEGECREFVTSIQINKELKQMRGTACKINNEWQLREIY